MRKRLVVLVNNSFFYKYLMSVEISKKQIKTPFKVFDDLIKIQFQADHYVIKSN